MPEICPQSVVVLQLLVWAGLLLEEASHFLVQDLALFGMYNPRAECTSRGSSCELQDLFREQAIFETFEISNLLGSPFGGATLTSKHRQRQRN